MENILSSQAELMNKHPFILYLSI